MQVLEYDVSFTTPAFLGNAEQLAQWRTPPFKALFRQWWRVANARHHQFDWKKLREVEGQIFGSAADDGGGSMKSGLRLRLSKWDEAAQKPWGLPAQKISHPEVNMPVDSALYLGYGPLSFNKASKTTDLTKNRSFLQVGDIARLRLGLPSNQSSYEEQLVETTKLASWFGAIGSRSRNGWGSLCITPITGEIDVLSAASLKPFTRDFFQCLSLDWPHAVGADQSGPLVWVSSTCYSRLEEALKALAQEKISIRTKVAPFFDADPSSATDRHLMGYPVTNHRVNQWTNKGRLAGQLRWKIAAVAAQRFRILLVHIPCCLPSFMKSAYAGGANGEANFWRKVHEHIDQSSVMSRISQKEAT